MAKQKGIIDSLTHNQRWRIRYLGGFITTILVYFYLLHINKSRTSENKISETGTILISICGGLIILNILGFIF